jgi:hypothetical protein
MLFILKSLSNREVAIVIWLAVLTLFMLINQDTRKGLFGLLKALFDIKIMRVLIALTFYVLLLTVGFYKIRAWHLYLLKDSVLWFFSVALVIFFNINKVDNNSYFRDIINDSIKWAIFLEFAMNFYTFSLMTELIIAPLLAFITIIKVYSEAYAKQDDKYAAVSKLFSILFSAAGWAFGAFVIYKTVTQYNQLLSLANLQSLLLPVVYTAAVIPFMYLLAVYVKYETLLIRIHFMTNNEELQKKLKRNVFLTAKLSLNRLTAIGDKLKKSDFYHTNNLEEYFQSLVS